MIFIQSYLHRTKYRKMHNCIYMLFPMNSISLVTCSRLGCFRNNQLVSISNQSISMTISLIGRRRQISISRLEQLRQLYAEAQAALCSSSCSSILKLRQHYAQAHAALCSSSGSSMFKLRQYSGSSMLKLR